MSGAILETWYAAMRSGNLESLRLVATPDIRISWNGPTDLVPWAGEHHGVDAAINFFRQVMEQLDVVQTTVTERIEAPDALVVFLSAHWRLKSVGQNRVAQDIMAKAVNVFRFREGKVSGYEVYPDSAAFARHLNPLPSPR